MREKYKRWLPHIYERLNNRRNDDAEQVSRQIVDNHSLIVFEDLSVTDMIEKCDIHGVNKAFYSVAWNRLVTKTQYKAEETGIPLVKVDPAYTSQTCSECGNKVPKPLTERTHRCDVCGLVMDRDLNAALNILELGRGRRPSSP